MASLLRMYNFIGPDSSRSKGLSVASGTSQKERFARHDRPLQKNPHRLSRAFSGDERPKAGSFLIVEPVHKNNTWVSGIRSKPFDGFS